MPDDVEPHVVRLRAEAAGWRRTNGPRLTPEEPFLTGLSEERAEALVRSQWALVSATVDEAREFYYGSPAAPFDPAEYSVDELEDALAADDYSAADLDALSDAERDGKDRTTALDAIDAARGDD